VFEDLLPAVEKSILEASGSIPVVFEGIEHNFEKSTPFPKVSSHSSHELMYLRSGRTEFVIDGKAVFLDKGSTIIIRPDVKHAIKILSGHADMVVLYFGFSQNITDAQVALQPAYALRENRQGKTGPSMPFASARISSATLESFLDFAKGESGDDKNESPYLVISGRSRQDIASLVERIMKESQTEAFARDLMMQFLAMELLVTLSRALREEWEESLRVKHGKARELVMIARDFLVENHDRDISVADAAAYVFLSQGYFTRAFRDELGISPMGFLMQVRVNHACKLLAQREIKVSGIALQVGFSSPQRFNVAFRKHMGMTPLQYRQMVLAEQ
jgi:AraC-like DNA-binding protein